MKILFFSPYFYPYTSGLTVYPEKILKHLSKKNSITVLTFLYNKKLKTKENYCQINIIRIPYLFKISKGFLSPQSIFYFIKEIKKNDILFLNLPNFEGFLLPVMAKISGKKIISLYHCHLNLVNSSFAKKIIIFFLNLSTYFQALLSNTVIGHIDYINKIFNKKVFLKKIKTSLPPITNLPISGSFLNKLINGKKNKIWVGYVGRIAAEKGLEYLIEAISQIKNKKIVLVFAGPYGDMVAGENEYFLKIKKILEEKKINYKFLGKLKNKQLGAFYKAIDLLVLPSINSTEAFGMVQAEAMLLGTPVIATNLPGVRIPIKLTKMGILIPPKNSLQLIKAIKKILKNKKKYSNKKLIKKAKEIFDIKKVYRFYEKLIND